MPFLEFLCICSPYFCRAWGSNQVEAAIKATHAPGSKTTKPDDYFYGIGCIGPRSTSLRLCLYLAPAGQETFPVGRPPFSVCCFKDTLAVTTCYLYLSAEFTKHIHHQSLTT
jgi:hypothetical protein